MEEGVEVVPLPACYSREDKMEPDWLGMKWSQSLLVQMIQQ